MSAPITDSELREELVAFGVDVGPITSSTRGLWLKKLDKLNAEKRKSRRSAPIPNGDEPALGNFSSDPDDDYSSAVNTAKSKANNNNLTKDRRQSGRHDAAKSDSDGGSGADRNGTAKTAKGVTSRKSIAKTVVVPAAASSTTKSSSSSLAITTSSSTDAVIPGLANSKNGSQSNPSSSSSLASKATTDALMKRYLGDLEEGEISDTDSENDRKLANGKSKKTSTKIGRKSITTTTTTAKRSDSDTEVKSRLKSIQNPDVGTKEPSSRTPSLLAFTRAFPDVPTHSLPSSIPFSTSSFPKTQNGVPKSSLASSSSSVTLLSGQKSSSSSSSSTTTSSLISGRPGISRQRQSLTEVRSAGDPSGVNRLTTTTTGVNRLTTTTQENRLILNDTVISDPHNSLPSETRPRLSMSSIGPRSSTPYNGHTKIDPLGHRKVIGVNGLAPRETLDEAAARPANPPPAKYQTTDEAILSKEFKTSSEGLMSLYSHHISVVIVVLAAGFFLLVALAYLNLFSYDTAPEKPRLRLDDASSETNKLLSIALEELRNVAIRFNCRQTDHSKVTLSSLIALLTSGIRHKIEETHLKEVFSKLREWRPREDDDDGFNLKLTFLDKAGKEITTGTQFHSIAAETDFLPIKCRLYHVVSNCAMVAVSVLFAWVLFRYYHDRKRKRDEKQKKLFSMVDSILDFVTKQSQARYSETGEFSPTFAISHVRDALIAPVDRLALAECWTDACQFIAKNESRVREETQLIKGEDYLVWRWVADPRASSPPVSPSATPSKPKEAAPPPPPSETAKASSIAASIVTQVFPSHDDNTDNQSQQQQQTALATSAASGIPTAQTVNQWQGQAFQNVRLNAPPFSLTQCLKIRNMFDPDVQHDPTLKVRVQDAILEKCGPTAHVQHVAINVDKVSREGCVYVKCRDADSAGVAYRALHGWWFDGKLVSVKYLPLKRYHERFPNTAYATTLLQPSSFKL